MVRLQKNARKSAQVFQRPARTKRTSPQALGPLKRPPQTPQCACGRGATRTAPYSSPPRAPPGAPTGPLRHLKAPYAMRYSGGLQRAPGGL